MSEVTPDTPEVEAIETEVDPNALVQLVTFEVGQQLFGLDVFRVKEVIQSGKLTPSPGAFDLIEGMIDLRGDIIPVIDLEKRLNTQRDTKATAPKVLIIEVQNYIFGLIVDSVNNVCSFPLRDFQLSPPGTNHPNSEFTIGITHQDERLLLYLDAEKVIPLNVFIQEAA